MEKWHNDVGPRVFATLEKLKKQSAWCIPRLAGESKYEVKCFGGTQMVVDLRNRSWAVKSHVSMLVLPLGSGNHISYVHDYYKKEAFMKAYKPMVHPMPSQDLWPKTNVPPLLPPKFHKQPGRPKKSRISSADEPSSSSNPKAKRLPSDVCLPGTITKAKEDSTSRQEIKSKSYKTIKAETATQPSQPSQSNQAQQPSPQPAQPCQASQFEQPSQASQFEQASKAALFEQASQSEQPNSSRPLQASPQRKVRLKSPAKRKAFLGRFKPWRY
ncbi:uncharacterized protein Pyn_12464 [Prunus yedoensis var. nudiflora]|uniref:Uncharacterized protein n=1 Tax=Prunus yedoensis var. nudiflora TaxID=2094558 RepID=A0A314XZS1_PRUYE|nr:uncharacterized protein Pyn_12464 [Prunus yedoensis var. nudiflora]